jgi:hypothetical protein
VTVGSTAPTLQPGTSITAWFNTNTGDVNLYSGVDPINFTFRHCIVSSTAPTSPVAGTRWFNTADSQSYTRVGSAWVQADLGPQGPLGPAGPAGPNTVTTSTTTNLTGYIFGNGTNIAGATTATNTAVANTLVLRGPSTGTTSFSSTSGTAISALSSSSIGVSATSGTGTAAQSESTSGSYHHLFGSITTSDNRSAVERVRGWFVWFFSTFTGRLKTADITANREWTLPDESGTVALDSDIYSDSLNVTFDGTYPIIGRAVQTTPHRKDTLISATSGAQTMTTRTGKWVESFTYDNFNNRVIDGVTSISFPDLVGSTGSIAIGNPILGSSINCTSISFPELKVAGSLTTGSSTVLSSLSFPKLEVITNGLGFGQALVTTLNFPELKSLGGTFTLGSFSSATFSSLTSITFPKLVYAGTFGLSNSSLSINIPNLTSFSVPLLAEVNSIIAVAGNLAKLKTVNYSALRDVAATFSLSNGGANAVNSVNFSSLENIGTTANLLGSSNSLASLNSVSYPALRNVGDNLTISSGLNSNVGTTSVLIGPNLKHVNGNISVGATRLDAHLNWAASTRYVAYLSLDIPASSFVVSNSSSTVTVTSNNHGLAAGDIITITGLDGSAISTHPANVNRATVATADTNTFTYSGATATSIIPAGTALVQREASTVLPTGKNGRKYIATTNGSSGSTEPAWPTTLGATIADSGVTWLCVERSIENLLSRFEALNGTNNTYTYGANRLITFGTGQTITAAATIAATTGIVTANAHGLTTGTQIFISGGALATLPYNGFWTITVTSTNTFTLNELSGSGWTPVAASNIVVNLGQPQFSGNVKVPTSIISTAADVHHVLSSAGLANVNASTGSALPVFVAGVYYDKGNLTNGFKRYECAENSWSIWYSTGLKRWAMTPNSVIGTDAQVSNYAYTQAGVPISSISTTGNPCTITTSAGHGYSGSSGSRFTVLIEGNSNASVNGLWTATYNNVTANFTIPVSIIAAGTGGTVTVLNQVFVNGPLLSSTVGAPVQAALMTVNMPTHGYSNGDFVHCSGAQGTNAASINNLNPTAATNANNSAITVIDASNFTFIRHGSTQPFIGTLSVAASTLTQMPLIRRSSNAAEGFNLINKLRARGVTTSVFGMV